MRRWDELHPFNALTRQRIAYFAHRKPLAAVVTNWRLPEPWLGGGLRSRATRWMRAVSPGPLCPLVIVITTAGGILTCGIVSRSSGYAPATVDAIAERFIGRLVSLEK